MRTAILTLPVLSTILACGPGAPGDTDSDPTTAGSSSETEPGTASTTASTTAEPATTDALPTTATTVASETSPTTPTSATTDALPTTGGETTDATTGPVETTTADPSTTTTTTDTEGAPDVAFAAQFWAGGLDHITIRMAALADDFCVELRFARPGGAPRPGLTLPTDWWYQGAGIYEGAADCLDFMASMPQAIGADGVAGVAIWDTDPFCPTVIDSVDIVLDFPQDQPWVPAQVAVATEALAVTGC